MYTVPIILQHIKSEPTKNKVMMTIQLVTTHNIREPQHASSGFRLRTGLFERYVSAMRPISLIMGVLPEAQEVAFCYVAPRPLMLR